MPVADILSALQALDSDETEIEAAPLAISGHIDLAMTDGTRRLFGRGVPLPNL